MKPETISLKEIIENTSIHVKSGETEVWLEKENNHLFAFDDEEGNVCAVKRYGDNDAGPILLELMRVFNLYWVSEYEMYCFDYDPSLITEEFIEEWRKQYMEPNDEKSE